MVDDEPGTGSKKGRATPSRKEAEAARRAQMKKAATRKDQLKAQRAQRDAERRRQREALSGAGNARDLPPRDRGPVKAFVRDYVDRRFTVAEFLLPLLLLMVVLSALQQTWSAALVVYLWMATILLVVVDEVLLVTGLRRQLRARFEPGQGRGTTSYAMLRSTQLRRFRLPKPAIARRAPLRDRY